MLAVAGGKGGCGKTTTTLGLALASARRGRTVLAVDADVDVPDLHRLAGLDVAATDRPGDVVVSDERLAPEPRPVPGSPRVDVLPAGPATVPDDLEARLRAARGHNRVLVDCPAGAGRDAAVPLRAADRTLLVSTATDPSLRAAAKTAAMSRAVGTPVAGAVLTRCERVPAGVAELLDVGVVEPLGDVDPPLCPDGSRRRYGRILRRIAED